ncbi:P-loop containing nucleoside triphosphate hydrolase protein [Mycena pura]|uniref:small monomeric GTPase n=1 Tax=Mycena pura TaxID=153505 RepID=A0AAD6V081_9AGAR|nr:P-loop containing nucleoside triphosphate hydrolase protein [Mycena pura]
MATDTTQDPDAWNIAVLGAPGVGKTRFFVLDDFEVRGPPFPRLAQGFSRKLAVDGQNTVVTLVDIYQLQRTQPSQNFHPNANLPSAGTNNEAAVQAMLREADGFILMYSTTSPYSLQDVVAYMRAVRRAKATYTQNPVLSLVGNQSDRSAQDHEVSRAEGEALARELDCLFAEVSAKTGYGVEAIVTDLVRVLRARKQSGRKARGIWDYFVRR